MVNSLSDAVSPYLRSHADNPVDWFAWGREAFAEAERRDVPVLVSIGYSTCHWCHVMARESFSDPVLAARLNADFVAIKVDREEHPDVDASYLAAAAAFTPNLGWPLNVFVTPAGRAFFAGTYFPPRPVGEIPAFGQVLDAVMDAWTNRREEVEANAAHIADALGATAESVAGALPTRDDLTVVVAELEGYEDTEFGGFGSAPKFPVVPVILFLLERAAGGDDAAAALARRCLTAMAGHPGAHEASAGGTVSALRDTVEGGFFRYATRRDWTEPHYERMLYDNAQLLDAYSRLERLTPGVDHPDLGVIEGIAAFLLEVLEAEGGGFASAQDSESTVDGVRLEGRYYELDAAERARQQPPALDGKILTGWNGLAIGALASAGSSFGREPWIAAARRAADLLIAMHLRADGTLLRASIAGRASDASATLEDSGMLAGGLLRLATATGDASYAVVARGLVDRALAAGGATPFGVPGGADPVLASQGLALEIDPSEGAYPSGLSAMAAASHDLYLLTGYDRYREASTRVVELVGPLAVPRPIGFGATLTLASVLTEPIDQLIVVTDDPRSPLATVARDVFRSGMMVAVVTRAQAAGFAEAGFELFVGRQREAAYLCHSFVCRLPLTDAEELRAELRGSV